MQKLEDLIWKYDSLPSDSNEAKNLLAANEA